MKNTNLDYFAIGKEIYETEGKVALLKYLNNELKEDNVESEFWVQEYIIHCPSCGKHFLHSPKKKGKIIGIISGVASGVYFGGQLGIAGGPFGAIAGTIPGAIIGGYIGNKTGNNFDKPDCPECKTSFEFPKTETLQLARNLNKEIENVSRKIIANSSLAYTIAKFKKNEEQLIISKKKLKDSRK